MTKTKKNTRAASKPLPKSLPFVVVRCTAAGVHAGELVSQSGPNVVLRNSRRLWQWRVPMGAPAFLSGVATHGLSHAESLIGCAVDITLMDACEVIHCSAVAAKSIKEAPSHVRTN